MVIEDIVSLCKARPARWTRHILERILRRDIGTDDVLAALLDGEIIEQYPADFPFPSCLVLGYTQDGKALHIVCGSDGNEVWLITAYFPNPADWAEDYKKRRKA